MNEDVVKPRLEKGIEKGVDMITSEIQIKPKDINCTVKYLKGSFFHR